MSTATLAIVLVGALGALGIVVNQMLARLALVEVTLNEGLPPGHRPADAAPAANDAIRRDPTDVLDAGVHVFLSRNCHACQRLLDDLSVHRLDVTPLALHYVDRPRPFATDVAKHQQARLEADQSDVAQAVGADPLPHTVAIGEHGLVASGTSPTRGTVLDIARNAGYRSQAAT